MNHRIGIASGLCIVWAFAGCSHVAPPVTTPTTQPAQVVTYDETDPEAAKSLEHELRILSKSQAEGLITSADFQQSASLQVAAIARDYMPRGLASQPFGAGRLHAELTYLLQLKSENLLTGPQNDEARALLLKAFFIREGMRYPDVTSNAGTLFGGPPERTKGQFAKDLEEALLALKKSHSDGVLNDKEYAQSTFRLTQSGPADPIDLDELSDEVKYLTGMKSRGLLTAEQFELFRKMMVNRYIEDGAPTSQPAEASQ